MSKTTLKLPIEPRTRLGTPGAHALRAEGKIPAVIYGHGTAPEHVAIERRAFEELLHHGGRNGIIQLTGNGKNTETAMVRAVDRNPISKRVIHADLQRVSLTESVHAKLPLVMLGVAPGVRDGGGVMDVHLHELEIEGAANALPEHIDIDVSALGVHQHITAGDVKLPAGLRVVTPADTLIVAIEASRTAHDLETADSAAVQLEPEVIPAKPEAE
jgi:large subunit ribosomal protein L25